MIYLTILIVKKKVGVDPYSGGTLRETIAQKIMKPLLLINHKRGTNLGWMEKITKINKCKYCNCNCHCSMQNHSNIYGICPCQWCHCFQPATINNKLVTVDNKDKREVCQ